MVWNDSGSESFFLRLLRRTVARHVGHLGGTSTFFSALITLIVAAALVDLIASLDLKYPTLSKEELKETRAG